MCRSLWQTPAAFTLIRTCVPDGCGVGASTSFKGALKSVTWKLLIVLSRSFLLLGGPCHALPRRCQLFGHLVERFRRQRCSATGGLPVKPAISTSERPDCLSSAIVCSPRVAVRLPAETWVPDIRNGRFMTLKVPPPSSTSASARDARSADRSMLRRPCDRPNRERHDYSIRRDIAR